jgi:CrcB protein
VKPFLCAVLGSAAGGGARYLIGVWAARRFGGGFPYGTLIVNLVGCFLMAFVMYAALTTGFLGGLTTYSAFNHETSTLLHAGATRTALLNAGVTLAGCFVVGLLGLALARAIID